jgi:hypothetical protein
MSATTSERTLTLKEAVAKQSAYFACYRATLLTQNALISLWHLAKNKIRDPFQALYLLGF